jgi:hypothetical protein
MVGSRTKRGAGSTTLQAWGQEVDRDGAGPVTESRTLGSPGQDAYYFEVIARMDIKITCPGNQQQES